MKDSIIGVVPGMYQIHDGASFPDNCPAEFARSSGSNGDELCVHVASTQEREDIDEVIHITPALPGYAVSSRRVDIEQLEIPKELQDLCDSGPEECTEVVRAGARAVLASVMCQPLESYYPIDQSPKDAIGDAVRHLIWSSQIARRFHQNLGYSVSQAKSKALEWLDQHEVAGGQTGCVSPVVGSSEEMDCNNNDIGIDVFASNANLPEGDLIDAAVARAQSDPGVIIINGFADCPGH